MTADRMETGFPLNNTAKKLRIRITVTTQQSPFIRYPTME